MKTQSVVRRLSLSSLDGSRLALSTILGLASAAPIGAPAQTLEAAPTASTSAGQPVSISVAAGARQTFAGFGASMGNWGNEYGSLPAAQRTQLARQFWGGLNFKILRCWFNVDDYSPTRGARDLSLFRKQYLQSKIIADAKSNGVTTLLFAPDHIPPYMRSSDNVRGPINDGEIENYVTLIASAIQQLREEDGLRIQVTGISNEPDMTAAQLVRAAKRLRAELDARGLQSVKIVASEASSVDDRFYSQLDAFRADEGAWKSLAGIASHSYNMAATDRAASAVAASDGRNLKEYWMTEASDNGSEDVGMTGVPAIRAASLAARFLNDMNHRVTHWIHFLGAEATKPPFSDDATRIIAFQSDPFAPKVMKKFFTYQQLSQAFEVGAVFRDSQSSLDGDMTWTYGQKPRLFAATARNRDGTWSIGVCNFTTDSFLGVQGWGDAKWNIEQGGHTPGQTFPVTIRIDELKGSAARRFVVHRTSDTLKNARAETLVMRNGEVSFQVAPLELVTLRSLSAR